MPLGELTPRETGEHTLARSRARAALIPDLLVQAQRVANSVYSGWHGRRKRGTGENFWQFRPYVTGETQSRIDWRRSARDEFIYVQDKEWQATHTIWLWVDESPSMLFRSDQATVSKQSRALVLALAMAELLARSGERVGLLGVTKPVLSRNAAEILAEAMMIKGPQSGLPSNPDVGKFSELLVFSDFLDADSSNLTVLRDLTRLGLRGHAVHIIDPVEHSFPYSGRVEFSDPETGRQIVAGNAQTLKENYKHEFIAHLESVKNSFLKMGWSLTRHHTDRLASEALVSLHTQLGQAMKGR